MFMTMTSTCTNTSVSTPPFPIFCVKTSHLIFFLASSDDDWQHHTHISIHIHTRSDCKEREKESCVCVYVSCRAQQSITHSSSSLSAIQAWVRPLSCVDSRTPMKMTSSQVHSATPSQRSAWISSSDSLQSWISVVDSQFGIQVRA